MADNHSPYDPDPRQGRGGDRRTQALQAVSHFCLRKLHFISPGAPRLRWVQTRHRSAATAGLERRQRAACIVGVTPPAARSRGFRNQMGARGSQLGCRHSPSGRSWQLLNQRSEAADSARQVLLQTPRTCQEKSRRLNKRTTRAVPTHLAPNVHLPHVSRKSRVLY